jgi:hypothetical protein
MHYWGNQLLFDDPPVAGDGPGWEQLFQAELGSDPRVQHRTLGWDHIDGALGCAREEFVARGYEHEENVGLVAEPGDVRSHPRENREVLVRALGPGRGVDEELWDAVVELQVAARNERLAEESYRAFSRTRLEHLRTLFRVGRAADAGSVHGWSSSATHRTAEQSGARCFVIVAEAGYHALGLYESLGFHRSERVCGVCQSPH